MYQSASIALKTNENMAVFSHALSLTAKSGLSALTVRDLASYTDVSASGFLYRFGSRENFLLEFMDWLIQENTLYWRARKNSLLDIQFQRTDLPGLMNAIVAERTTLYQAQAIALWEFEILSTRMPEVRTRLDDWRRGDLDFWAACFEHLGLPEQAIEGWAGAVLAAKRISLLGGDLSTNLAWVHDVLQRLYHRILGEEVDAPGDSIWRAKAEAALSTKVPIQDEGTPSRIISAASEIILEKGCAALSHRAISKHSGVSLSSTTHHFRTLNDIMLGAFEKIYADARATAERVPAYGTTYSKADFLTKILPKLSHEQQSTANRTLAMEEIALFTSRHENMHNVSRALYAQAGSTMTPLISAINDVEATLDRLDGHVTRLAVSGIQCSSEGLSRANADDPLISFLHIYL